MNAIPEASVTIHQKLTCASCGRRFQVNPLAENHAFWCPECCAGHEHLWVIA